MIHAPLSGLVVDIPVLEGQAVDENQIVLILESMKMENEIRTPRAGTVREVKVQAGAVVRDGDVLLTVC
jgi:biotin carboxyl carrier protein